MYTKICVALDGSATGNHALSEALKLSEGSAAALTLLCVIDVRVNAAEGVNFEALYESWRREGQQVLDAAAARVRSAGMKPESVLVDSDGHEVGDLIIDEAVRRHADAIVIGTHGRKGLAHVLLGSVAERVVRSSPVPVLTVRGKGR